MSTLSPEALEAAAQRAIEWNSASYGWCSQHWYAEFATPDDFDTDEIPVVVEYG